ncbi:MAG: hypothetical protein HY738_19920 [Bacteroidia bacterium]|nr:hypothetical protein [Bacteroidia bacterium]
MRNNILLNIILLFTFFNIGFTQESEIARKIIIKTSPLAYLPDILGSGNFNICTEIYLKNKISLDIDLGYMLSLGPSGGFGQISAKDNKGFKINIESKKYINKYKIIEPVILLIWPMIFQLNSLELQNSGYYFSINTFYQYTQTEREERVLDYISDIPHPNSTYYKFNYYTVNRNRTGLNIKFGYQAIKKCGFILDQAIGLGIQYISSYSNNKFGNDDSNDRYNIPVIFNEMNKKFDSGSDFFPNFVYTLKIGWLILN